MTDSKILIAITLLLVFVSGCASSNHDALASCLTEKGVKMYGAFWCPHCERQKDMFGSSFEKINYTECSLPDRSGQTKACIDKNIEKYPTWEFPDGSRVQGVLTFDQLKQKSGCSGD